jgi:hypothetical protein
VGSGFSQKVVIRDEPSNNRAPKEFACGSIGNAGQVVSIRLKKEARSCKTSAFISLQKSLGLSDTEKKRYGEDNQIVLAVSPMLSGPRRSSLKSAWFTNVKRLARLGDGITVYLNDLG